VVLIWQHRWEHGNMGTGGGGGSREKWLGPGERDASTKDSRTACLERLALVRSEAPPPLFVCIRAVPSIA
jgi:hypothetical protein